MSNNKGKLGYLMARIVDRSAESAAHSDKLFNKIQSVNSEDFLPYLSVIEYRKSLLETFHLFRTDDIMFKHIPTPFLTSTKL